MNTSKNFGASIALASDKFEVEASSNLVDNLNLKKDRAYYQMGYLGNTDLFLNYSDYLKQKQLP